MKRGFVGSEGAQAGGREELRLDGGENALGIRPFDGALIATGLPCRGVMASSPTYASIHVNWSPGAPQTSSLSSSSDVVPRSAFVPLDDVARRREQRVADEELVARGVEISPPSRSLPRQPLSSRQGEAGAATQAQAGASLHAAGANAASRGVDAMWFV